jgi:hypothetical protein
MRLPSILPADLTAERRPAYGSFEKTVHAKEHSGFEVRNPDGAYIGPWGGIPAVPGAIQAHGARTAPRCDRKATMRLRAAGWSKPIIAGASGGR